MDKKLLIKKATEAMGKSYSPYSKFRVGAALLTKSGKIFTGCNIESVAFTATVCAERTAIFKAVSEGEMEFEAIAIIGGPEDKSKETEGYCGPCGVCRQVMLEFCEDLIIILAKSEDDYHEHTLKELLPLGFGPGNLK